jgi:PD-(D/E)XK nuclease superfamily
VERLTAASERGHELHADKAAESPEGAEVAFAWDVLTGKGRELGRNLGREYPATAETEIVGSTDKILVEQDRVVIRDYKSGRGFGVEAPAKNLQLGFYAVAGAAVHGKDAARVELEFLDQEREIGADLDALDLAALRERIRSVWRRASEPQPKVVTGDHCTFCPCIVNCPAHLTMAVAFTEGIWPNVMPSDGLTIDKVAQGWEYLKNAKRVLGLVEKTYRAYASQWPVPLSDSKVLGAHDVERDSLDGVVTFQVLRDLHGEVVARAAVSMEATKSALDEALKPIAAKGQRAGMVREALAAISAANGVKTTKRCVVEEFQPKEGE